MGMTILWAGLWALNPGVGVAQTAEQVAAAKDILAKVPAAELASRGAQLVADAPPKEKAAVASAVGQAVASTRPELASAVVASISTKVPVVAPAAAAAAAGKLPDSAAAIALAAASVPGVIAADVRAAVIAAAPRQAVQIVSALVRAKLTSSLDRTPPGRVAGNSRASADAEKRGRL